MGPIWRNCSWKKATSFTVWFGGRPCRGAKEIRTFQGNRDFILLDGDLGDGTSLSRLVSETRPDDYVIATGETHTVREFVELEFSEIGRKVVWSGEAIDEVGRDERTNEVLVSVDPRCFRPAEVDLFLGDLSKAKRRLGWSPRTKFSELVRETVAADLSRP